MSSKVGRDSNGRFTKGSNCWVGRKHTEESKARMSKAHTGKIGPWRGKRRPTEEKSSRWVGDDIKYGGLHDWVRRKLGRPTSCWECTKKDLKGKKIHWANVSGKYKRNISDWVRLCVSCHKKYDNGSLKLTCR